MLEYGYYTVYLILNLNKAIHSESVFQINLPPEDQYECYSYQQGYNLLSFQCNIVTLWDIEPTITFSIRDYLDRLSNFTFPTFVNSMSGVEPTVYTYGYGHSIADLGVQYKQFYYIAEFVDYHKPIYYIQDYDGHGQSSIRNKPIYGSLDGNYTILNLEICSVDQTISKAINFYSDSTPSSTGLTSYTTSNSSSKSVNITVISTKVTQFDIEITAELSNLISSFLLSSTFGQIRESVSFNYPMAVVGRSSVNNNLIVKFQYLLPPFSTNLTLSIGSITGDDIFYSVSVNATSPIDTTSPVIQSIEYLPIDGISFIIQVVATDDTGVFKVIGDGYTLTAVDLVSGSLQNATFQQYINTTGLYSSTDSKPSIQIFDSYGNFQRYDGFYGDYIPIPQFHPPIDNDYLLNVHQVTFVRFAMNDIDLTLLDCNNTIYFNLSNIDVKGEVTVSFKQLGKSYNGFWNEDEQMFSADFNIPSRLFSGYLEFTMYYESLSYDSIYFKESWKLRARSDYADMMPPMVLDIVTSGPISNALGGIISWNLTIEDKVNGLDWGMVTVLSLLDPYYSQTISIKPQEYQSIYLDTYTVEVTINPACLQDTYFIDLIWLFDKNGYQSYIKASELVLGITNSIPYVISPLMYILDNPNLISSLSISVDCQTPQDDTTPPVLTEFLIISDGPINLFSWTRQFFVNFTVQDTQTPISYRHAPRCYFYSTFFAMDYVNAYPLAYDPGLKSANYSCMINLPYGIGYPSSNILISINGITDEHMNIIGYSTDDIIQISGFNPLLNVTYDRQPMMLEVTPISNLDTQISIVGYGFGLESNLIMRVEYIDSAVNLTSIYQSENFMIYDGIRPHQTYFLVSLANQNFMSNKIVVSPIVPPNNVKPPLPCMGTPICGGSNGVCTLLGCQCNYPWTGNDCMSQIVIIPSPFVNTSNPDIHSNYTTTLPNGQIITLSAYIKIEALRELDSALNEVVKFQFNSWEFKNTTSPLNNEYLEYQYKTTVFHLGLVTKIKVTIQFYTQVTVVYFANSKIAMLPSTIKYKIELTPYKFTSNFNQLQFLMSASFDSSEDDSCSYQEHGDIINSDLEYVRLQVNQNSLYCRFIKRGVIDNRIISITNTIFPVIEDLQTTKYVTRMVGINIPFYRANALVDPDFSILSDILPAGDKIGSLCEPSVDDGLTRLEKIGIIIAVVAFVLLLIIGVILYKVLTNMEFRVKFHRKFDSYRKEKTMKQLFQTICIVILSYFIFKYLNSSGLKNTNPNISTHRKIYEADYGTHDPTGNMAELRKVFKFSKDVEIALRDGLPIVALESTIISHGMPFPKNYETAKSVEQIVRDQGVVPATIAIINGTIHVGMTDEEILYIAQVGVESIKTSRRDLPYVVSQGKTGSTTVSSTILISSMVGIKIFVTGGLGGVHRNAEISMDVSADLTELGRNGVAVVCAGVKSILDIGKTLEYLETQGVTVLSYQTSEFPAFFTKDSGHASPMRIDDTYQIAKLIYSNDILSMSSGVVVAVPNQIGESEEINRAITESIQQSERDLVKGKDITPYLLKMVNDKTKGKSLELNIQLIKNNAKVGSEIALQYYNIKKGNDHKLNSPEPIKQISGQEGRPTQPTLKNTPTPTKPKREVNSDLIVIGGCVIDMISKPNKVSGFRMETSNPGHIEIKMGGVARNIAEVLARLDQNPMFISAVGSDQYAELLINHFESVKLDTQAIARVKGENTAIYNAILDEKGDLSVAISQMEIFNHITPQYLQKFKPQLLKAKMIIIDTNIPIESMIYLHDLIQQNNPSIKLWVEPTSHYKSMKPIQANITSSITYTSPNTDELFAMAKDLLEKQPKLLENNNNVNHQDTSLESIKLHSKVLIDSGMRFIITKMGPNGMLLSYKKDSEYIFKVYQAPNVAKKDIIDVTGAGDSLCGGVIYSLYNNISIEESINIGSLCAKESLLSSHPVSPLLSKSYLNDKLHSEKK
ncbi:hypothetical protein DLAC_00119 [Tieghemostelium lacteum]|uniref:Uncharacterized protein n=1 Tax=Tieghemostelium lacteum TaxID=361077 RepID=A0A152A961_TIELA|nr:hypothetical protein DLAC_00119 [Tieghemostelium lacteum]|eukprot:KYR02665.1 hypothetical protein DLAC_00119 [Tieghemostelium lacteum]